MLPKPPFNNRVWNYLSSTLQEFKVMLLGYRSYTALLSQTGTDAPVEITVLENTLISNILFEYENVGTYLISGIGYPSIFKYNKTFVIIGNSTTQDNSVVITAYPADEGSVRINTTISNVLTDGITGDFFPIEIRVYN